MLPPSPAGDGYRPRVARPVGSALLLSDSFELEPSDEDRFELLKLPNAEDVTGGGRRLLTLDDAEEPLRCPHPVLDARAWALCPWPASQHVIVRIILGRIGYQERDNDLELASCREFVRCDSKPERDVVPRRRSVAE